VETKSLRHAVLVVAAATVVLALVLVLLVVPVYGPGFEPAVALGLILLPGVALLGIAGPLAASVVGRGRPGLALAITLATTPLTIALYATLIPALDATGAALASTISYATTFVLWVIVYGRVTGMPVLPALMPTRSELADYRALWPVIAARARGLRRARPAEPR
jgi:O-antigen/teichoic acid export membrane protein